MEIQIRELTPEMKLEYVDFFDNRAFCDGNVNMGCYCVWHHWTEEKEYERSQLPEQDRPFCKRNYALELIEQNILHGFAAFDKDKIIGFCNADLKDNYFRLRREKNPDSWIGIDNGDRVLAIVCFTVAPDYRGQGIAKMMLNYACEFAERNGYDYVESYPVDGKFDPQNCCGSRPMYEAQGFSIINVQGGIVARKEFKERQS